MPFPTFREMKEDFKAWRRGEKRVAPYGSRGRVYARKVEENGGNSAGPGVKLVKSEPEATLHMKVIRGDGTVEDLPPVKATVLRR